MSSIVTAILMKQKAYSIGTNRFGNVLEDRIDGKTEPLRRILMMRANHPAGRFFIRIQQHRDRARFVERAIKFIQCFYRMVLAFLLFFVAG